MHRKSLSARLGGLAAAAVLATTSAAALTDSSSAAIPIPFTQKVVKISNAYQLAQCSFVIDGHDFNGNNIGYITAQSQGSLLAGQVKGTEIDCYAFNASWSQIDEFTYVGNGAFLPNTRKNGSYGVSSTYHICIVLTRFDYKGGSTTSPVKCN
jgi:hypothetical protein